MSIGSVGFLAQTVPIALLPITGFNVCFRSVLIAFKKDTTFDMTNSRFTIEKHSNFIQYLNKVIG